MINTYNSPIVLAPVVLTDEQVIKGSVLTDDNIRVINRRRAELAQAMINLDHTGDQLEFYKQHYFAKGMIAALEELLALGADAEHKLLNGATFDEEGNFVFTQN